MRRRLLALLARFAVNHPGKVLAGALLVTVLSLLPLLAGGRFETDLEGLLPEDEEQSSAFLNAMKDFGATDVLLIVFEAVPPGDPAPIDALKPALSHLSSALLDLQHYIREVEYMVGKQQETFLKKSLGERAFLYLEPQEFPLVKQKFSEENITASMKQARAVMSSDVNLFRKRVAPDPLNFLEVFEKRLARMGGAFRRGNDRYYTSPDGAMLVMVVRPVSPVQDLEFDHELMKRVRQTVKESLDEAVEEGVIEQETLASINTGYAGAYPNAVYDDKALREDIFSTFGLSVFVVLLLFGLVFRRLGIVFYVGTPLVVSVLWALGLGFAVFGRLSIISGGFAAILVGLGIDFAIHIYNRYAEEREEGADTSEALVNSVVLTGEGILFGALTTSIAFFGVSITKFEGLSELGFLAGAGVLLEMLAMLVVLPSMLVMRERIAGGKPLTPAVFGFGLEQAHGFIRRFSPYLAVFVIGSGILSAVYVFKSMSWDHFDSEFRNLKPRHHPILDLQDRIMAKMDTNVDNILLIAVGESDQQALKRAYGLKPQLKELMEEGEFLGFQSLTDYVPPRLLQQQAVEFIRTLELETVRDKVARAARRQNINPKAFAEFYEWLDKVNKLAENPEWVTVDELKEAGLGTFLQRFYARRNDKVHIVTYAQPRRGKKTDAGPGGVPRWEGLPSEWYEARIKELGADGDTLIMTSARQVAYELRDLVYSDFRFINLLVFGGVAACLFVTFVWPLRVLVALLPLATGLFWMVALMLLTGFKFNYINVIVLPAVLGIGIDNAIHILHRYREEMDISLIVGKTGRALMMTSLTTMLGFGSLVISRFPGIRSLGILAFMGVGLNLIASLVGLNSFLHWLGRYVVREPDVKPPGKKSGASSDNSPAEGENR